MKQFANTTLLLLGALATISTTACNDNGKRMLQQGISIAKEAQSARSRNQQEQGGDNKTAHLELPATTGNSSEMILTRRGYTVSYNKDTRLPNWVAWRLTAAHANGSAQRKGIDFQEDADVPEPRATDTDYRSSGYDRGHMCPAGDNKWSRAAMEQSFLFTNICPQAPQLNRGDWNELETACRKWAKQYGDVYIVCGPILYNKRHKTIGKHKVVVPEAFFKVVLCMKGKPKAIGFIYKNADGNRPKGDYANSVDEVERITGLDFFPALPDKVEREVEAECNPADWDI